MPHQNHILASLPASVFEALKPHFNLTEMKHEAVLAETGGLIECAFFPRTGVISLVVEMREGDMLETAMVGRDGVMGASSALDGSKKSLNKAIVQVPGTATTVKVEKIREAAREHDVLRARLIRHEQVLFASAQQSAACNGSHLVESRLCRWLLRMRDLAGDDLPLTQEFLGQMIGVRRSSVSLVAGALQAANLIRYRRGHIRILNVEGLEEVACECHQVIRQHYADMLNGN